MYHSSFIRWLLAGMALSLFLPVALAQETGITTFGLESECESSDTGYDETILGPIPDAEGYVSLGDGNNCQSFVAVAPDRLQTPPLAAGESLTIRLMLSKPTNQAISEWVATFSYDPAVLRITDSDLRVSTGFFEVPIPGQNEVDTEEGLIMLGAATAAPEQTVGLSEIEVATITITPERTPEAGTMIMAFDIQAGGQTDITALVEGVEQSVLNQDPSGLQVVFATGAGSEFYFEETASEASPEPAPTTDPPLAEEMGETTAMTDTEETSTIVPVPAGTVPNGGACQEAIDCQSGICASGTCVPNIADQAASEEASEPVDSVDPNSAGTQKTAFSLLQVQNLRVSSEGSSIYLAWDKLESSIIKAYNIYYGTTSGRYIQRQTVTSELDSVRLTALPLGDTYFLAIRAVSNQDEESAFSREVAIEVGNAASASTPLIASLTGGSGQVSVAGDTGPTMWWASLVTLVALLGTALVARRRIITTNA